MISFPIAALLACDVALALCTSVHPASPRTTLLTSTPTPAPLPIPLTVYITTTVFTCPSGPTASPTCTTGTPVIVGSGTSIRSTITYALVTPVTPFPSATTFAGYLPEASWAAVHSLSSYDIVLPQSEKESAQYSCQASCELPAQCRSFFVGFLIKGAGGYFWRCTAYNALITPELLIPTNNALLREGTGWDRICCPQNVTYC